MNGPLLPPVQSAAVAVSRTMSPRSVVATLTVVVAVPLVSVTVAGETLTFWLSVVDNVTVPLSLAMVLPKASTAVMVEVKPMPTVAVFGAITLNAINAAGLTVMRPLAPWMPSATAASVTVSAVSRVTVTVAVPLTSLTVAGDTA